MEGECEIEEASWIVKKNVPQMKNWKMKNERENNKWLNTSHTLHIHEHNQN